MNIAFVLLIPRDYLAEQKLHSEVESLVLALRNEGKIETFVDM